MIVIVVYLRSVWRQPDGGAWPVHKSTLPGRLRQ